LKSESISSSVGTSYFLGLIMTELSLSLTGEIYKSHWWGEYSLR